MKRTPGTARSHVLGSSRHRQQQELGRPGVARRCRWTPLIQNLPHRLIQFRSAQPLARLLKQVLRPNPAPPEYLPVLRRDKCNWRIINMLQLFAEILPKLIHQLRVINPVLLRCWGTTRYLIAGGVSGTTTLGSAQLYDASFGLSCTSNTQCVTGFCVNGVCCDTACNGGCGACNLTGKVGTCSAIASGTVCRASTGTCDVAETCNGTALTCPTDGFQPSTRSVVPPPVCVTWRKNARARRRPVRPTAWQLRAPSVARPPALATWPRPAAGRRRAAPPTRSCRRRRSAVPRRGL